MTLMAVAVRLLSGVTVARASITLFDVDNEPVTLTAQEQSRGEVWNWFAPPNPAKGPDFDNRYHFLGSWIRVGAGYQIDGVKLFGELMSPFFFNLPNNAIAPPPQGALGLGGNYYQPHQNPNDASVFLKQGFVEFGDILARGLDIKGGRFEFVDGREYMPSELDSELNWLAANRVSQRLIGNFGFSDVTRSFDGAVASYGDSRWQATAMYGTPTKGVYDLNGMDEVGHTDLIYMSVNAGPDLFRSEAWGKSLFRIFYIYYSDTRGLSAMDNTGAPDKRPISIDTIGADYVRAQPIGPGVADLMLWSAGQLGAWGKLNQGAYAFAAETGYRLLRIAWKPWLRAGYMAGSGDGDKNDSTHGTFFQILPTPRAYAMTPFYNMMNINDAMVQMVLNPREWIEIQTSIHGLWLDSRKDLWYSGGGAFDNRFFGYVGRPAPGHGYLGTLTDIQLTWKVNEHISSQLYYGHIFGGDVIGGVYPNGREGDFGFIQMTFSL